jgi:hypothetical protein
MTYQHHKIPTIYPHYITYYLALFLPLIAMGPLKFSQTHQTLLHI